MKRSQVNTITECIKTMKRLFWLLMLILPIFGSESFSKDWNGIVPCTSVRSDAERVLGKNHPPINLNIYRYKKSRIQVRYRENKNDSNKDVVERIDVFPDKSELLAKYIKKIPNFQRDFRKTELPDGITHVYGLAVYANWTEGFEIWVQKNEEDVEVITRFGYFDWTNSCSKILPASPVSKSKP